MGGEEEQGKDGDQRRRDRRSRGAGEEEWGKGEVGWWQRSTVRESPWGPTN